MTQLLNETAGNAALTNDVTNCRPATWDDIARSWNQLTNETWDSIIFCESPALYNEGSSPAALTNVAV